MKKRAVLWSVVLAAVAVFAAWMLWPRALAASVDATAQLSALVIRSGVENGRPWSDSTPYEWEAGAGQGAALRAVLEQYSYHLCLDTLLRSNAIEDTGTLHVQLHNADDTLSVFSGTGKLFLNGWVVRLNGGSREAERLCGDLLAILEPDAPEQK